MTTKSLGKMKKITDLRKIWPHEARDFTTWLAEDENLNALGEAIGINIMLEETESSVGGFNVDLYATEENTGRRIVIENQLEDTNHDHLGKIITYASGKDAKVVIWLVKKAREEHKRAIEWLNNNTTGDIGFFLLEIELWQINDSVPAPKFNIVERPNNWAKTMRNTDELTETKKIQLDYWQTFVDFAFKNTKFAQLFSERAPQPQHWYDLNVGRSSYHISLLTNTKKHLIGIAVYISNDRELYENFLKHSAEIEKEFGHKLKWIAAEKDCRIVFERSGNIKKDASAWPEFFAWYCEMATKLRSIFKKYEN